MLAEFINAEFEVVLKTAMWKKMRCAANLLKVEKVNHTGHQ